MTADMLLVVSEVAIFGAGNVGVMLYKFGAMEARLNALEKVQSTGCPPLFELAERVASVEATVKQKG